MQNWMNSDKKTAMKQLDTIFEDNNSWDDLFFGRKFVLTVSIVLLLSFMPIFLFANSGVLVVKEIWGPFKNAGYAGWIPLFSLQSYFIGGFFGIGTLPLILIFRNNKRIIYTISIWTIASFLGFITTIYSCKYLAFISWLLFIAEPLSVFMATFFLMYFYEFCTSLIFSRRQKSIISVYWVAYFTIYSFMFGGLEWVGTWGGIPIFRMYTIIAWHMTMSLILTYYSFKLNSISKDIIHENN